MILAAPADSLDISPADVQAFAKEVFQRMYIETLVHGNTTPEVSITIRLQEKS
jgi:hypothetical protein